MASTVGEQWSSLLSCSCCAARVITVDEWGSDVANFLTVLIKVVKLGLNLAFEDYKLINNFNFKKNQTNII